MPKKKQLNSGLKERLNQIKTPKPSSRDRKSFLRYVRRHHLVFRGRILVDALPEKWAKFYKQYLAYFRQEKRIKIPYKATDARVYLHKYYPWCYKDYIPTVSLQGWYNLKIAKEKYRKFYGPKALKYVHFSKGKDLIQKKFRIQRYSKLYINGIWQTPRIPLMTPEYQGNSSYEYRIAKEVYEDLPKTAVNTARFEKVSHEKSAYYEYGRKRYYTATDFRKKEAQLQKLQEAFKPRESYIQEEPSRDLEENSSIEIPSNNQRTSREESDMGKRKLRKIRKVKKKKPKTNI